MSAVVCIRYAHCRTEAVNRMRVAEAAGISRLL